MILTLTWIGFMVIRYWFSQTPIQLGEPMYGGILLILMGLDIIIIKLKGGKK